MRTLFILMYLFPLFFAEISISQTLERVRSFDSAEAHQGVAVDGSYFYPVATTSISKHDKETGEKVAEWMPDDQTSIVHLDSGVIVDGKLYASHSNYPGIPMTSSVEVWDTETMKHIESHSFGIFRGSFTWLDRHDQFWWAGFANYDRFAVATGRDHRWTTIIKFDDNWNLLESWVLPEQVLNRMKPMSNSGGSWGPDEYLYLTGHDLAEVYKMSLPESGSELVLEEIVPITTHGQGIAWDRSQPGIFYTISRSEQMVNKLKFLPN